MSFVRGIDVHPSYQTVTDWAEVAGAVDFLIQKATEHTTFRTPNTYYKTAKARGILTGAYHFFRPDRGAVAQADWFVAWLRDAGWQAGKDLPPVLDLERTDGASDSVIRGMALAFMNRVEDKLGIGDDPWQRCMIYMNGDWRNRMGPTLTAGRVLWLASWPSAYQHAWPTAESSKPGGAGLWQFVGGEKTRLRVPGVKEGTDLNVALLSELKRMAPKFYNNQPEEDDMTPEQDQMLKDLHRNLIRPGIEEVSTGDPHTAGYYLGWAKDNTDKLLALANTEAARDAVQQTSLNAALEALGELVDSETLPPAQAEALAQRIADLTTLRLIGEVSGQASEPAEQ